MRLFGAVLTALLILCCQAEGAAQRRVSPVRPETGRNLAREVTDTIDVTRLKETVNDAGKKVYVDTVTGREVADSLVQMPQGRVPKMIQPLLFSATAGVDIWDPVMRCFGQKYGLVEFSAELNLHNRYIPVVEVGIGETNNTPARQNFTYKVSPTPYFRLGMNYNFLYNSNPAYMAYAGLRLGLSPFSYSIRNVTMDSGYWDETQTINFPKQNCTVMYMQLLFGIRVRIAGSVSMGWAFRYKARLHESSTPMGKPWYIPGYGTRNGAISGSFSVFYTFQLSKPRPTDQNLNQNTD